MISALELIEGNSVLGLMFAFDSAMNNCVLLIIASKGNGLALA